jgi:hypothetical protein
MGWIVLCLPSRIFSRNQTKSGLKRLLWLLPVCIALTFAQPARSADTGYKTPGADGGNPTGWTNFSYTTLASATGSQTYSPANTTPGFVSTFTFGIPDGAQIDGIEVHVYGYSSKNNNTSTFGVELSGDNGSTWTTPAIHVPLPTVLHIRMYTWVGPLTTGV